MYPTTCSAQGNTLACQRLRSCKRRQCMAGGGGAGGGVRVTPPVDGKRRVCSMQEAAHASVVNGPLDQVCPYRKPRNYQEYRCSMKAFVDSRS